MNCPSFLLKVFLCRIITAGITFFLSSGLPYKTRVNILSLLPRGNSPFWLRQGPCLRCNRQAACSVCPWSRTPQWRTYKFSNILVTREIGKYGVLNMWFITRSSVKTDLNCNEWVSGLTGSWRRCCQRSSWQRRRGRPGRSWTWLLPLLRVLS